ncbi:tRNA (guanosine(46)-N7)-methyltransferase TrmB [Kibdelosporangium persicum]|uniref:tRNA (guanine-N(7)-)-methyltransferase n=2 Tax=Kibdelosporangium persicum TaxID=2698649 RepID=A0ABX2EYS6_9PSEU|nr:tRNA (guanine-N(7)-)-methyltransferase [Kibdelosporangium persicum]
MEQQLHRRTIVSYVQRGGRMTAGQERAWERYWPRLGQDVSALPAGPVDTGAWFGRSAPVVLEIGSGMGETTAKLAAAAPEVNYLAVEVYQAGLAQLMMRAAELGLTNLRLLRGDAVILLTDHIAPDSLSEVRLYFPDPWPKKRHHKRRIVQPDFVSLVASRLAPGGRFHMATDWEHYAEHMLEVCTAEPGLRNVHSGWAPRPQWRPVTKFESRAHAEGRDIRDLIFEKAHSA